MKSKKKIHPKTLPEFKSIFSSATAEEDRLLEASVLREGIRHKIVVWKGYVVDGHRRLPLAIEHDVPYETEELNVETKAEVIAWIIEHHLGRRNLSQFSRIVIALKYEDEFRKKAKKNQGSRNDLRLQDNQKSFTPVNTTESIAKIAHSNPSYVKFVRKILAQASPEEIEACHRGEVTLPALYSKVNAEDRAKKQQELAAKQLSFPNPPSGSYINTIIHGDAVEKLRALNKELAGEATCVITSPPYNIGKDYGKGSQADSLPYDQYLSFLGNTFRECSTLLRKGGRLIVIINSLYNNERPEGNDLDCYRYPVYADLIHTVRNLDCGLKYWQDICWHKKQPNRYKHNISKRSPERPILHRNNEYIIIWSKEDYTLPNITNIPPDITDEEFAEWELSSWLIHTNDKLDRTSLGHPARCSGEVVRRLIKLFSYPGDVIVDPFVGSGTTTAVAAGLGRQYIGIDQHAPYCDMAKKKTDKQRAEWEKNNKNNAA